MAIIFASLFALTSPIPASFFMRWEFSRHRATQPPNYEEKKSRVAVTKNLIYPSKFNNSYADIYTPTDKKGPHPTVLWIHGGAFVGGDKSNVEIYATALAAEGFSVVCINYELAPKVKYPTPVRQTNEAYLWLFSIADEYSLDLDRFIIAGDSAGAHVAAQFAAIQSNKTYAAAMNFAQTVPMHTLKAALLFCGPYDVTKIDDGSGNFAVDFFIRKSGLAYFGTKDWSSRFSPHATILHYVTKNYPPTFITDGNELSFEDHAAALAAALEKMGITFEADFIAPDTEAGHQYQFLLDTDLGQQSFEKAVKFIKTCIGDEK